MRTAFINQLVEEASKNDKIFLLVGDLGFSVVEPFRDKFPDRFLNVGVAEQNMMGIASGLAKEGYCVFTYSIGNFPTLRSMEQIRYDICYHNLNVKVIAVGGGYAYGALGASHHCTEELGMLRTLPNLVVSAPGDPAEARKITTMFTETDAPCYMRLGRAGEEDVHTNELQKLELGQALEISENDSDIAVLCTGSILRYAQKAIDAKQLNCSLYSFPFIKPMDKKLLLTIASKYSMLITLEDHQKNAGFGSAVLEVINELYSNDKISTFPKIKRFGINDEFISIAGNENHLREKAIEDFTKLF